VFVALAYAVMQEWTAKEKRHSQNKTHVLQRETPSFVMHFSKGKELGSGQFGTIFLCTRKADGSQLACKQIPKCMCHSEQDREDIRREVKILHHLDGHSNVVGMHGAYEDRENVYIMLDACNGGELFDDIISKGSYTEREAAEIFRTMLRVVAHCHSLGVMHRDLKPENFLLSDRNDKTLKATDFGMSVFYSPQQCFDQLVGSPYYIAPEVLKRAYGAEADMWSIGVILYILLSGMPPFFGNTDREIFNEILCGKLNFKSEPWPRVSEGAKDCIRKMLCPNPSERMSADEALKHPWVKEDGIAQDTNLGNAVVDRMMRFQRLQKFKKLGLFTLAQTLNQEEVEGLMEMFKSIDKDGNGTVTVQELQEGLKEKGYNMAKEKVEELVNSIDVNGDRVLDYSEFIAATLQLHKATREDNMVKLFQYFDKDESGYISKRELVQVLQEMGMQSSLNVEELIASVDQDDDGHINFEEFVGVMRDRTEGNPAMEKQTSRERHRLKC
jgi:calcium-dependent protein kinase